MHVELESFREKLSQEARMYSKMLVLQAILRRTFV